MKVKVKERQTLLDIALETAGTLAAAMEIAAANGLSVIDRLADGWELEIAEPSRRPTVNEANARVVRRYRAHGVEPATEASAEDIARCPYGGIGEMGIEIDFEIV